MLKRPGSVHAVALLSYGAIAIAFTWPLAMCLNTRLTGTPGGDTGVYVWNQWVFRHELIDHRALPYFTDAVFSLTSPANLSTHNYTTFQDLLALPLQSFMGVVAAFNVVYLITITLTAYTTFLLARHVTAGANAESWIAGVMFGWSPLLVTRGMGHFSVAAAAPLAAFLLALIRMSQRQRLRDAALVGIAMWWAASTDAYFAIFCLLLGSIFIASSAFSIGVAPAPGPSLMVPWVLNAIVASLACLLLAIIASGGWEFSFLGGTVRIRGLYTPVLLLTVSTILRVCWSLRLNVRVAEGSKGVALLRLGAVSLLVAAVLMSPVLYALGTSIASRDFDLPRTFWRNSPAGVDLVAMILPNPNHPFAPASWRTWLSPQADAYLENVVSVPLVALIVMALAWWRGWRAPRLWVIFTAIFGLLALGPFIHVGGLNTYIPGPWALLRYVPVVSFARTPARFSVVFVLALAILFAAALTSVTRSSAQRRIWVGLVTVLLFFELVPARTLYSAEIPSIYRRVAAAPETARVLELPFGVRDGTMSVGDFTARSQLFQTYHHKRLFGGYLSRVSGGRVADVRRYKMLDALMVLSDPHSSPPTDMPELIAAGPSFAKEARVSFVVVDRSRASPMLLDFAVRALQLVQIGSDGELDLYAPRSEMREQLSARSNPRLATNALDDNERASR